MACSMTGSSVITAYDPSQVTDGARVMVVTDTQFAGKTSSTTTTGVTGGSRRSMAANTTWTAPQSPPAIAAPSPATLDI